MHIELAIALDQAARQGTGGASLDFQILSILNQDLRLATEVASVQQDSQNNNNRRTQSRVAQRDLSLSPRSYSDINIIRYAEEMKISPQELLEIMGASGGRQPNRQLSRRQPQALSLSENHEEKSQWPQFGANHAFLWSRQQEQEQLYAPAAIFNLQDLVLSSPLSQTHLGSARNDLVAALLQRTLEDAEFKPPLQNEVVERDMVSMITFLKQELAPNSVFRDGLNVLDLRLQLALIKYVLEKYSIKNVVIKRPRLHTELCNIDEFNIFAPSMDEAFQKVTQKDQVTLNNNQKCEIKRQILPIVLGMVTELEAKMELVVESDKGLNYQNKYKASTTPDEALDQAVDLILNKRRAVFRDNLNALALLEQIKLIQYLIQKYTVKQKHEFKEDQTLETSLAKLDKNKVFVNAALREAFFKRAKDENVSVKEDDFSAAKLGFLPTLVGVEIELKCKFELAEGLFRTELNKQNLELQLKLVQYLIKKYATNEKSSFSEDKFFEDKLTELDKGAVFATVKGKALWMLMFNERAKEVGVSELIGASYFDAVKQALLPSLRGMETALLKGNNLAQIQVSSSASSLVSRVPLSSSSSNLFSQAASAPSPQPALVQPDSSSSASSPSSVSSLNTQGVFSLSSVPLVPPNSSPSSRFPQAASVPPPPPASSSAPRPSLINRLVPSDNMPTADKIATFSQRFRDLVDDSSGSILQYSCEEILDFFQALKNRNGQFNFIHEQEYPSLMRFSLLFKSNRNGASEKNFWHTKLYQQTVKRLKEIYLHRVSDYPLQDASRAEEEKNFIDYFRGNAPLHHKQTETRIQFNQQRIKRR